MTYKALYREWRPKNFREVIGQDHVNITLQNAIESGRIAHAYLFSGPRGTGKTSTAKILAKALNCESGPTTDPCNQCEACLRINNGSSLDVMEIDAASNRGIDEIRDLREKVKLAPSEGRFKVYIIDEVHMLTPEAFNALLKTLEEPPSSVIFILATTEPHKIPSTILSRVQRFDFKRINIPDIIQRLRVVLAEMPGEVDENALLLIARKAEGGMRDALSLLDQCYTLGERLSLDKVVSVLGSLSEEEIFLFVERILQEDILGIIYQLDKLLLDGKDPGQILKELTEHIRNLLILKTAGDARNLIYVSREFWPKLVDQSSRVETGRLTQLITLFIKTEGELRFSAQPRITLEVALIRASSIENSVLPEVTASSRPEQVRYNNGNAVELQVKSNLTLVEPQISNQPMPLKSVIDNQSEPTSLNLSYIKNEWKKVLEAVKKNRIGTYAFLVEGTPVSFNSGMLTLGFKERNTFHRDKIEQPENKKVVEEALFSVLGYPLSIKCVTAGEATTDKESDKDLVNQTYRIFPQELVEIKD